MATPAVKKPYTEAQYRKMDRLISKHSSLNQQDRIEARLDIMAMKDKLGEDVCRMMAERSNREHEARRRKK